MYSVMCVATLEELSGAVAQDELDVVIFSASGDPLKAWLRLHRLTDAALAFCLVAAVCCIMSQLGPPFANQ